MTRKNEPIPAPPEHLSEKSKELFTFYAERSVETPAQIALLVQGLEALDMADECTRTIAREGLTVTSERSGLTRQHPTLNTKREATATMLKAFKMLGLHRSGFAVPGEWGETPFI